MATRWFRRRWEESRGDQFSSWGPSTWFFEVGSDGCPIQQMEVYDQGPTLRYGADHQEDEFGQLSYVRLDEIEDWTPWAITHEEFAEAWAKGFDAPSADPPCLQAAE